MAFGDDHTLVPDEGRRSARLVLVGERGPIYEQDVQRFLRFLPDCLSVFECWIWRGNKSRQGYGKFWWAGHTGRAIRFISEVVFKQKLTSGVEPDHLCSNPSCVNPLHLEVVTRRENIRRGKSPVGINYRKTHCKYGHAFTPENTAFLVTHNERRCKKCQVRRATEYYKRHHEKVLKRRRRRYALLRKR